MLTNMAVIIATVSILWPVNGYCQKSGQEVLDQLKTVSGKLSGNYKGPVMQVLNSIQRKFKLTYSYPEGELNKVIAGSVKNAAPRMALQQILEEFNYLLTVDAISGAIHIEFLCRHADTCPGSGNTLSVTKPTTDAMHNKHQEGQTQAALNELPPQLKAQFEAADQETEITLDLQEHFDAANQETGIPPELQEQFAIANQKTAIPPELLEQFAVANQKTEIPPDFEEQFAVANQKTEIPSELQEQFEVANQALEIPEFMFEHERQGL